VILEEDEQAKVYGIKLLGVYEERRNCFYIPVKKQQAMRDAFSGSKTASGEETRHKLLEQRRCSPTKKNRQSDPESTLKYGLRNQW